MKTSVHRNLALYVALAVLVAGSLACSVVGGLSPTATPTPTPLVTTFVGAFDCNGIENGLGAYAGRLTFDAAPDVGWDSGTGGAGASGQYNFDPVGNVFTFQPGFVFDSAVYDPNSDSLVATVTAGTTLAHADGGTVSCVRSQPGITGPN